MINARRLAHLWLHATGPAAGSRSGRGAGGGTAERRRRTAIWLHAAGPADRGLPDRGAWHGISAHCPDTDRRRRHRLDSFRAYRPRAANAGKRRAKNPGCPAYPMGSSPSSTGNSDDTLAHTRHAGACRAADLARRSAAPALGRVIVMGIPAMAGRPALDRLGCVNRSARASQPAAISPAASTATAVAAAVVQHSAPPRAVPRARHPTLHRADTAAVDRHSLWLHATARRRARHHTARPGDAASQHPGAIAAHHPLGRPTWRGQRVDHPLGPRALRLACRSNCWHPVSCPTADTTGRDLHHPCEGGLSHA